MSTHLTIEPTKFTNVRTGDSSFGVRVYDEYMSSYNNTWISIPADDMDVLVQLLESSDNDEISIALESVKEHQSCLFIGGLRYEWDEIQHLF